MSYDIENPSSVFAEAEPGRYKRLASGAVIDTANRNRIVANPGGGVYGFTAEKNRDRFARLREMTIISHMRGLARGIDFALPDNDAELEEVARGASNAVEALVAHMTKVFLESKNVRGLAEALHKLTAPMLGEPSQERDDLPADIAREIVLELARLARQANDAAITGDVINVTPE